MAARIAMLIRFGLMLSAFVMLLLYAATDIRQEEIDRVAILFLPVLASGFLGSV
jgi:hypothetical protein